MVLMRAPVALTGFSGGPGVNVWHFGEEGGTAGPTEVQAAATALGVFYDAIKSRYQVDVTITVPPAFVVIEPASGQPQRLELVGSPVSPIAGGDPTAAPHFQSAKVQLRTGVYREGREIRGGPFLGPLAGIVNQSGGTWGEVMLDQFDAALATLVSAMQTASFPLAVYRYPRPASSPLGARDGDQAVVSSALTWEYPAVQRSRRL